MSHTDYTRYTLEELRIALDHLNKSDTARVRALEEEIFRRNAREETDAKRRTFQRKTSSHLASPPRTVPFALLVRSYFGGVSSVVGWGLFAFGMIFFWAFAMQSDLIPLLKFSGEKLTTQGIVQFSKETNSSENDEEIIHIGYAYQVGTEVFTGESYTKGMMPHQGDAVFVEYLASKPSASRLQGGRMAIFGAWAVLVTILPLGGLIILLLAWRTSRRYHKLLQHGSLGFGTLVSAEPTNVTVNDRQQYKYTFEFLAGDQNRYQTTLKTHQYERVEDEEEEMLLYLPAQPRDAVLLDEMPSKPIIGADGNFTLSTGAKAKAYLTLILPVVTIIGNMLYLVFG